jgi:hypothetical protein
LNKRYDQARPHIPMAVERKVRAEAGHRCGIAHCGDIIVEIHHIDGNRENNDPQNLIPLCGSHHARAHQSSGTTRISREDLRFQRMRLSAALSVSAQPAFIRSEEARRVSFFVKAVRDALSWHDGERIQFIDDQFGYWFPTQVYNSLCALVENGQQQYLVDARSFDPEALEHQDAIMAILRQLVAEVSGSDYKPSVGFFSYRPAPKGSPGYNQKVENQIRRFNKLANQLVVRLQSLDAYVAHRPHVSQ